LIRHLFRFFFNFSSLKEIIDVANNAALIAPSSPIATVPTGIPLGICAIDNKLSKPFNFKIKTTRDFGGYFGYYITVMTEDQEEIDLIFFRCDQNPRKEFPIIVKTLEDSLGLRKLFDSAENG